jgi:hypothetical protein
VSDWDASGRWIGLGTPPAYVIEFLPDRHVVAPVTLRMTRLHPAVPEVMQRAFEIISGGGRVLRMYGPDDFHRSEDETEREYERWKSGNDRDRT